MRTKRRRLYRIQTRDAKGKRVLWITSGRWRSLLLKAAALLLFSILSAFVAGILATRPLHPLVFPLLPLLLFVTALLQLGRALAVREADLWRTTGFTEVDGALEEAILRLECGDRYGFLSDMARTLMSLQAYYLDSSPAQQKIRALADDIQKHLSRAQFSHRIVGEFQRRFHRLLKEHRPERTHPSISFPDTMESWLADQKRSKR